MVVEVPFRLQDAKLCRQDVRDGFLRSRFAGRAGDADDGLAPKFADGERQALERGERVWDNDDASSIRIARNAIIANDGGDCAGGEGGVDEIVSVEVVAVDSEEEVAGLHGA